MFHMHERAVMVRTSCHQWCHKASDSTWALSDLTYWFFICQKLKSSQKKVKFLPHRSHSAVTVSSVSGQAHDALLFALFTIRTCLGLGPKSPALGLPAQPPTAWDIRTTNLSVNSQTSNCTAEAVNRGYAPPHKLYIPSKHEEIYSGGVTNF